MIVDLNNFVKPRLYIMDGIMAMEGNVPRGGSPRAMSVLLFSTIWLHWTPLPAE